MAGNPEFDAAVEGFGEVDDPELAAAIEASYRSQSQAGVEQSEEQMLAQAMHLSRLEEAERQRRLGEDASSTAAFVPGPGAPQAARGSSALPPTSAGSSSSAASSSAAVPAVPRLPSARTKMARDRIDEEEEGSVHAVAGGSSRGSSREPGSPGYMSARDDPDLDDPHLAAAIEASYAAQTEHGMVSSEQDMIQQALRMSQIEEESRQRAALKEQQEVELQESIFMDQQREQEEKRRRVEEEELRRLEATRVAEEEERRKNEQDAKRARVPPEPAAGEPGRVDLMVRTPDGKRLRRAFLSSNTVGQVYDYLDLESLGELLGGKVYRLVQTMPRKAYEDRSLSLEEAGLTGQCALLVEMAEA